MVLRTMLTQGSVLDDVGLRKSEKDYHSNNLSFDDTLNSSATISKDQHAYTVLASKLTRVLASRRGRGKIGHERHTKLHHTRQSTRLRLPASCRGSGDSIASSRVSKGVLSLNQKVPPKQGAARPTHQPSAATGLETNQPFLKHAYFRHVMHALPTRLQVASDKTRCAHAAWSVNCSRGHGWPPATVSHAFLLAGTSRFFGSGLSNNIKKLEAFYLGREEKEAPEHLASTRHVTSSCVLLIGPPVTSHMSLREPSSAGEE
jgi:hypothetical protein